ncbi:MAG: cell division protein FtsL [Candidatus Azotimanducaceae bacterium]
MTRETLIGTVVVWFMGWTQITATLLVVVGIASALGVIQSVHVTRQQYSELQELRAIQDNLDSEYEMLLLEQSAWADYARIDQVARDDLMMFAPTAESLIVVKR